MLDESKLNKVGSYCCSYCFCLLFLFLTAFPAVFSTVVGWLLFFIIGCSCWMFLCILSGCYHVLSYWVFLMVSLIVLFVLFSYYYSYELLYHNIDCHSKCKKHIFSLNKLDESKFNTVGSYCFLLFLPIVFF